MERLDLRDGAYVSVYENLGFLPSTKEKAFESLIRNTSICRVKDLCLTKREKLIGLPNVSKAFVDGIESYLNQHGLRLGMTMDELYDYMDEAYLEELKTKAVKEEALPNALDSKEETSSTGSEKVKTEDNPETESDKGKGVMDFELAIILCSFLGAFSAITFELILDCVFDFLLRLF